MKTCAFKNSTLKSISNMRKVFVIVHAYLRCSLTFLDKNFSAAYSVPGKVHRNWAIIDM